jgi:hypothetical protein
VYFFPEPPYFLMLAGFLASLASGVAFSATLKDLIQVLRGSGTAGELSGEQRWQLLTPFLGIAIGSCVFLGSGTEVFGFPKTLAYEISIPMTLFIGRLIWTQLISNIKLLLTSGPKAFDLDNIF